MRKNPDFYYALAFTVIKHGFFPLKTASDSQIKELLLNMERKPYNQAEVEKLITEKNADFLKKSSLEGTGTFLPWC